jgi:hypothetical protein
MNAIEQSICQHLQHEGVGSVYERVVLSRWFRALADRNGYTSVLEYRCPITKGYDNITFVEKNIPVTVADEQIDQIRAGWKFAQRPNFSTLQDAPPADLVWNFAQLQMEPGLLEAIQHRAKKHVLIFVPNIFNPGTPIHLAYHLFTRTACKHAERGSVPIRTRAGLLKLLADHGINVIESGYVDVPPIPDIAFSIRELKETLGLSKANHHAVGGPGMDPERLWQRVQQMTHFENSLMIAPFKSFFGHHIYALGRVA